jgi:hypothetical protein
MVAADRWRWVDIVLLTMTIPLFISWISRWYERQSEYEFMFALLTLINAGGAIRRIHSAKRPSKNVSPQEGLNT